MKSMMIYQGNICDKFADCTIYEKEIKWLIVFYKNVVFDIQGK